MIIPRRLYQMKGFGDKFVLISNLVRKSKAIIEPLQSKFFQKKPESFIGINLGGYSVKGLVVKENIVTDFFLEKRKDLSTLLKEVWQKKEIATNKVKISIKDPSTLIRYFSFPKVDKKKLRDALFYELNKYIPFPPDEVYFDFAILEETSPSELFILVAAAKKNFVDNILNIFEAEGLKISEISLDSICLTNLYLAAYKDEKEINSCLLDLGHAFSTLTILKQGVPYLSRDLGFNTKDLLEIVSRLKNISLPEAQNWLVSLKNYDELSELAGDSISNLYEEVKSSFDYFELNKGERIEKLYLTGGLATLNGIVSSFKDSLDVAVDILDNFQNLALVFPEGDFSSFKNNFSVAVGLVL